MKKVIISIVAVVLVIALAGGGFLAYLAFKPKESAVKVEKKAEETAVVFIPLETFTVNLAGAPSAAGASTSPERFAQIGMNLALTDPKAEEPIKQRMPLLRDRILRIIAQKTAEQLLTPKGKDELAKQIVEAVKSNVQEQDAKGVKEVLFNIFIIQ